MNTITFGKVKSNRVWPPLGSSLPSGFVWFKNSADVRTSFVTGLHTYKHSSGLVLGDKSLYKERYSHPFLSSFFKKGVSKAGARTLFLHHVSPHLDKEKRRKKLFIRQLSKTNHALYLDVDLFRRKKVFSFRPTDRQFVRLLYRKNSFHSKKKNCGNWLNKETRSIFSFDLRHDQLLFTRSVNTEFLQKHFYQLNLHSKLGYLYKTNVEKISFLSSDVSNLGLSWPTYTLLKRKGIHKIGSLLSYSPQALFQLVNRNREIFAELRRCSLLMVTCSKE